MHQLGRRTKKLVLKLRADLEEDRAAHQLWQQKDASCRDSGLAEGGVDVQSKGEGIEGGGPCEVGWHGRGTPAGHIPGC